MLGTAPSADVGTILDVNGIRTFFLEQGDGEAVVMIHGAAPGYGRSDRPADPSPDGRVRHARAFIDALGLTHYHLDASADGANIAARLALEDPRVDRLVLVSGGMLAPSASGPQHPIAANLPSLRPKTLILWGKNDPTAAADRALHLFDRIPGAELHVFGASGQRVQWDQAERFNRLVADFLRT
jgi:pimeloyl-ACP methyl ester carboxylesterase